MNRCGEKGDTTANPDPVNNPYFLVPILGAYPYYAYYPMPYPPFFLPPPPSSQFSTGITSSHTMQDLNTSMQNLQLSPNQQNALNSNHDGAFHGGHVQHGNGENALENKVEQMKRSQSLPRSKNKK